MAIDYTQLDASIEAAAANATDLEGEALSIAAILGNVGDQIVAAIVANDAINQENTDKAVANVRAVVARNVASAQAFADAIAANSPKKPV